jgi:hypothetical protein
LGDPFLRPLPAMVISVISSISSAFFCHLLRL